MPQCQFLFSTVFYFRKVTQEIFLELDATKANILEDEQELSLAMLIRCKRIYNF